MILGIFSKKQNPNGSENAGHAIYWFKGLIANKRGSGITGFSGLHLLHHWERAPKMVQEVGLGLASFFRLLCATHTEPVDQTERTAGTNQSQSKTARNQSPRWV